MSKNTKLTATTLTCDNQNVALTMIGSDSRYTALVTKSPSMIFDNSALSYNALYGRITSTDSSVASSSFSSDTGILVKRLTGTLTLTCIRR